jgi:hypothetical protein
MSLTSTPFSILDENKRRTIVSLVTNGSSRRVAARFVGCAPSTITRTVARFPEFAERLIRAEQAAEVTLLKRVQTAAEQDKYWRAAAWLLERRNPEDFAARPPRSFTTDQVAQILGQLVEVLRNELPAETCRHALEKLDGLLAEFEMVEEKVAGDKRPKEERGE